jgi:Ca2+-binding RTX toxin-like protein
VFHADGSQEGEELVVNTSSSYPTNATITALADGRFVVAWTDYSASGDDISGSAIRARIFDPRTSAIDLVGSLENDDFVGTLYNDTISGFIGNDTLRGGGGSDRISGEDDDDSLFGDAGNDILDGGTGKDTLLGGAGSDRLLGGEGDDSLDGGAGKDLLNGGGGNDLYVIDTSGDRVIEAPSGGLDTVSSATLPLDLGSATRANVENATLLGTAAINLTGSATANVLIGNAGANRIQGRAGSDRLTGGDGADQFLLDDPLSPDTITDFRSGSDKLWLSQDPLAIGNGDNVINGGLMRSAANGFASGAELVIFSKNISGLIKTTNAASAIGRATSNYIPGATCLFAVDNGRSSALFLFTAANGDAIVSASELTLLATLSTTASLALADVQFIT